MIGISLLLCVGSFPHARVILCACSPVIFVILIVAVCAACTAETTVGVAARSTMAPSQLLKGFRASCPSVTIGSSESAVDYVIEANGPNAAELLKHYRLTLFDKQGKPVFSTDKHSPGAATKDVCKFLTQSK